MMSAISFDTLAYAKRLIVVGVPSEQAEVQAEIFAEIIDKQIATKHDLKEMEMRITIRLGAMMAASIVFGPAPLLVSSRCTSQFVTVTTPTLKQIGMCTCTNKFYNTLGFSPYKQQIIKDMTFVAVVGFQNTFIYFQRDVLHF